MVIDACDLYVVRYDAARHFAVIRTTILPEYSVMGV
jgi:hypothetical protein